jgi:hypothetical protein
MGYSKFLDTADLTIIRLPNTAGKHCNTLQSITESKKTAPLKICCGLVPLRLMLKPNAVPVRLQNRAT